VWLPPKNLIPLSWVTSKKVRAKPQPCFSALSASRGALWLLSMSEAWSYQHFRYQCPNRQRSTHHSLQYLAEMDMAITGCLSSYKRTKKARSFEYFIPAGITKFGATLSIRLFSMKCTVRLLTSPTSSSACKAFQVSSDCFVGLAIKDRLYGQAETGNVQLNCWVIRCQHRKPPLFEKT